MRRGSFKFNLKEVKIVHLKVNEKPTVLKRGILLEMGRRSEMRSYGRVDLEVGSTWTVKKQKNLKIQYLAN